LCGLGPTTMDQHDTDTDFVQDPDLLQHMSGAAGISEDCAGCRARRP
jgi:hypothetical protein